MYTRSVFFLKILKNYYEKLLTFDLKRGIFIACSRGCIDNK